MKKLLSTTALLLAGLSMPSAANATVEITSTSGDPGYRSGRIVYTPGGIAGDTSRTQANVGVGGTQLDGYDTTTLEAVMYDAFCVDILNALRPGTFEVETFALSDLARQQGIEALLSNTVSLIESAATLGEKKNISAGIQMAIWEIGFEAAGNPLSLVDGDFYFASGYGNIGNALTIGQGFLDNLGSWSADPEYQFGMLSAAAGTSNQAQVFLVKSAVPEPATWMMMLLGFGMVGGMMRRRRRTVSVSYA